ncbi:MAG: 50S ribosomal protein L18 [Patescibacteria group bacterium]
MNKITKNQQKERRINRVRSKIKGTGQRPRLAVFRSQRAIYAQLLDDAKGRTLVAASSRELSSKEKKNISVAVAQTVGELIAKKAKEAKITSVVFDRRGYKYHGRVKALAEGARQGGLKF